MENIDLLICISNDGYDVSLEPRKIYRRVEDAGARQHNLVRVIDESGEDYLYPETLFGPIDLSVAARKALHLAE